MKKFLTTFSIVAALVALSSCNKEIEKTAPETTDSVRTVHFTAGPVTKTVFGEAVGTSVPTLWTPNQTVAISLNLDTYKQSSVPEVSEDRKKATFTAEFDASTGTFYAVSPYVALLSVNNSYGSANIDIAASQAPLENSVDEKAQILVAKKEVTSESTSDVVFSFEHFTAYGKFGFSNLSLADGEKVASVSLTAEENWAGRFYYYFGKKTSEANSAGKTISLTTDKTKDIWFACAPVDLGGTSLSVVITTDKGTTYSKTVEIPEDKKFESGKINAFTIDMSGIKADGAVEYDLVTDASRLSVGSQVIIAASNDNFAISTTQNSSNRGQASVTKSGNKIVSPGEGVQILTLEKGSKDGTWAFNTGNGYLYAASSSGNQLKTETKLSDNSSWKITIDGSGVASIIAQGTNTRNFMQYNQSSELFACYASASQAAISIYMPDDRESVSLTFPQDSYELEVDSDDYSEFKPQTATIEPSSLAGKVVYSISDNSNVTSGFNTTDGSFTLTGKAGTATITASYAGDDSYKSAKSSYTVKVFIANDWVTEVFLTRLGSGYGDNKTVEGQYLTWYGYGISERNSADNSQFEVTEALTIGQSSDNSSNTNYTYANFESSPIAKGISSLKFEYCGNGKAFKVEVVVDGSVVWSKEGLNATATKQSSEEFQITGASRNAVIRFVNTSGSRRVTIGNISWK